MLFHAVHSRTQHFVPFHLFHQFFYAGAIKSGWIGFCQNAEVFDILYEITNNWILSAESALEITVSLIKV